MKKYFLNNKPFALLLILNIFFLLSQLNYQSLYNGLKKNIKYSLGEIGVEKYKKKELKLDKPPLVIYFNMENSSIINKSKQQKQKKNLNVNSDLILPPGFYNWGGETYNLQKEGYYNMIDFKKNISRNFIIYKKNTVSLLSSISWLHTHGNKDQGSVFEKKYEKLKTKKLSLTCGYISNFTHQILSSYKIPNRLVSFITMDKWNTYDNGHTLLEVKIEEKWVLIDIDNNSYFSYNNKLLNAKSLFEQNIDWQKVKYKYLAKDSNLDAQNFGNKNISYHAFGDYVNNDLSRWHKRVMQIPLMKKSGILYTYKGKFKEDFLKHLSIVYPNLKFVAKNVLIQKFYGEKNEHTYN